MLIYIGYIFLISTINAAFVRIITYQSFSLNLSLSLHQFFSILLTFHSYIRIGDMKTRPTYQDVEEMLDAKGISLKYARDIGLAPKLE